jgi:hypothetical protein
MIYACNPHRLSVRKTWAKIDRDIVLDDDFVSYLAIATIAASERIPRGVDADGEKLRQSSLSYHLQVLRLPCENLRMKPIGRVDLNVKSRPHLVYLPRASKVRSPRCANMTRV